MASRNQNRFVCGILTLELSLIPVNLAAGIVDYKGNEVSCSTVTDLCTIPGSNVVAVAEATELGKKARELKKAADVQLSRSTRQVPDFFE
uniref:Uncharacterized protein n=1 Tax=Salix viminalis TaxID=40686 RepID=A0A6N2K6U5_SALVM